MNIIGTNIISSLGFTTHDNYTKVKQGFSGLKHYDAGVFDLPEPFMASLIDKEQLNDQFSSTFDHCRDAMHCVSSISILEKATLLSISTANQQAQIDLSHPKTLFILSTTKGNVHELDGSSHNGQSIYLWHTAKMVTDFFRNPNRPIVVSNACISGAAAQISALRAIQTGDYNHVVVAGVDLLSKFIISGFQSFKALSIEPCRPFDQARCGLNLGEAAATMIFSRFVETQCMASLQNGAIRNDSTHISAPSKTGEGSVRALNAILQNIDIKDIAFINAHGTATPYNDSMEATALVRTGLAQVPVNSLKSVFGHTLGAAGLVESIVSIEALNENMVLKSLNFEEQNFENKINISKENHTSLNKYFIKMMSGFGGVNAALLFKRS